MTINQSRIIELDSVDSTNSYAERLLKREKVPEKTVIWAHEQTAGKGQGDNPWLAEPLKNLTLTMILYPGFLPVDRQFLINKAVSLGVIDFIKEILPKGSCKIKWPNDICYGNSKLGGILIAHTISGNAFDASIIGIGININQTEFDPAIPCPVSVKQITAKETDLAFALNTLTEKLDHRYHQLRNEAFSLLDEEYKDNLSGVGEERRFRIGPVVFPGKIKDVDPFGRLVIETGHQGTMAFAHGEIEFFE